MRKPKSSINETELPTAMIPGNINAKLDMAIDKIKDTKLTYNQKLKLIGKIIDSLGIDKNTLVKISTRLKGTLESVNEGPDYEGKKFKLGTPAIWKYKGKEYRGEVVMNPKHQRVFAYGNWSMYGKGSIKGILTYDNDTFVVPDDWKNVKSFNESINEDENDAPASPEEMSMAENQLGFIHYAAGEIEDYLEGQQGGFPEWLQNKLTDVHSKMRDIHGYIEGERNGNSQVSEAMDGDVNINELEPGKHILIRRQTGRRYNVIEVDKKNKTVKIRNPKTQEQFVISSLRHYKLDNVAKMKEAAFGFKDSTASYIKNHNDEWKVAEKLLQKVGRNEINFYEQLNNLEQKIDHPKYMKFLSNALRGFKVDMYKDPKIKNQSDAEEALYLLLTSK